jgi:hypothetical protein
MKPTEIRPASGKFILITASRAPKGSHGTAVGIGKPVRYANTPFQFQSYPTAILK